MTEVNWGFCKNQSRFVWKFLKVCRLLSRSKVAVHWWTIKFDSEVSFSSTETSVFSFTKNKLWYFNLKYSVYCLASNLQSVFNLLHVVYQLHRTWFSFSCFFSFFFAVAALNMNEMSVFVLFSCIGFLSLSLQSCTRFSCNRRLCFEFQKKFFVVHDVFNGFVSFFFM